MIKIVFPIEKNKANPIARQFGIHYRLENNCIKSVCIKTNIKSLNIIFTDTLTVIISA